MLTYCEPEVFRLWKEYRKALLGAPKSHRGKKKTEDAENQSLAGMITQRIACIREVLSDDARGSGTSEDLKAIALDELDWAKELDAIIRECCEDDQQIDIESIERRLSLLDKAYIHNLLQLVSKQEKEDWTQEIENELLTYKGQMDKDIYQQTLELGMESLLRERLNVRRISLYAT